MLRADHDVVEVQISGDSLLLNGEPGMPETICMAQVNKALHDFFNSAPVGELLGDRTLRFRIESYPKEQEAEGRVR